MDEATGQQIVSLLTEIRDTLKTQGMVTASASSGSSGSFGDEAPAKRYQNADGEWVYEVPKHKKASKCRSCQAEIWWVKSKKGKNVPVNADGICHYETCTEKRPAPATSVSDDVPF